MIILRLQRAQTALYEAFYIAWIGLTQAAANSYAIKTAVMPYLYLSKINSDDQHIDGWGLFEVAFDFIVISTFSVQTASAATLPRAYGKYTKENDPEKRERLRLALLAQFANSLLYSWFFAIPVTGFSLFYSESLLTRFGPLLGYSDPEVIKIASSVLRPLALMMPFVMTGAIARMVIRSCKFYSIFLFGPPILFLFLVLARITAFDLKMGLNAVLFCYIAEAAAGCSLYTGYFLHKKELAFFRTTDIFYLKFSKDEKYKNFQSFLQFLKLGSMTFLETFTNYFFWLFMATQSKSLGVPSQTAFALLLGAQWIVDLSAAANALSGSIELNDKITDPQKTAADVNRIARVSVMVSGIVGAIIPMTVLCSPSAFLSLSGNQDPDVAEKLRAIVLPMVIAIILNPMNLAKSYQCRAMKNFRDPAIARIVSLILGAIAGYILAFPLGFQEMGLAAGCALGMMLMQILLHFAWRKCLDAVSQEKQASRKSESPRLLFSENSSSIFSLNTTELDQGSPTSTLNLVIS